MSDAIFLRWESLRNLYDVYNMDIPYLTPAPSLLLEVDGCSAHGMPNTLPVAVFPFKP